MVSLDEVQSVVDQVLAGDREAFRMIVRRYGLAVRSYLAGQLHHLDDADDLAQEVFLTAYRNLPTFRRGEDFGAWLRGIARNKVQTFFRSRARRASAMDRFREEVGSVIVDDLDGASSADTAELIERLLNCVSRLPERLRKVVRAGLDGDRPSQTAELLKTTVGNVYTLHWRANHLLRECMAQEVG